MCQKPVEVPQGSVKILNQKYLKAVLKVAKFASSNKSHPFHIFLKILRDFLHSFIAVKTLSQFFI